MIFRPALAALFLLCAPLSAAGIGEAFSLPSTTGDRITPEALGGLLRHAARHPQGALFVQSLSVAGVSGTAAKLAQGGNRAARGNAFVKTGTLRDVTGIAGYVNAANGAQYVVVGFVNHPNAPAARPALDALLAWTAALPD